MKIILQESYMNLGEAGDIINVKPGYARNFLIPQKLAVSATAGNLRKFQDKAKELTAKKERERDNSRKTLGVLEKVSLTLKKKISDEGKLFGAVTSKEIEAELAKLGATVDRRQIVMGRQIKMIGEYSVLVKLVGGLRANIPLKVIAETPPKEGTPAAALVAAMNPQSAAAAVAEDAGEESSGASNGKTEAAPKKSKKAKESAKAE